MMEAQSRLFGRDVSWSSIPTHELLAEISRRQDAEADQPACGSNQRGAYDTSLHVFALFLILALSTLACGFPLFSRRASQSRRSNRFVFLSQHFGTGVLLATAFVHLLPTAFQSLTDPCLPYLFSQAYKPMPGLIAMISALVVVTIESYLTTRGAGHSHSHHAHDWESDDEDGQEGTPQITVSGTSSLAAKRSSSRRPADIALGDLGPGEGQGLMAGASPLPESTPTSVPLSNAKHFVPNKDVDDGHEDEDEDEDDQDLELNLDELDPRTIEAEDTRPLARPKTHNPSKQASESNLPPTPSPEEQKRLMLQCLMLEAGILFHSIFIGMAVSVATGPPFVVFLIAIAFHQTFEGLALGSRIAAIQFPRRSIRPWLMVLAYGMTTPIGQAIGLVVHNMYDPMSQTGLLMVGFMNAISSGLLLFAGLVQLLAEDFLTEKSYKILKGRNRAHAFSAVIAGAMLMAAVGAFA
ncbi:Zinc/iron permease [Pseudomassariella vexata]|uniref:Zinc/iron permease n=1 Tax=Pseudomassariella vexata TaxID=1141098 RepID=A0A1Y2DEM0_9PEZI|nr:Zinc/iron permease [Pseudomassariella vexata]ORY57720.1 Zinc/iron permease [Pseudomassariella vexata]